jgi:hypothetical protein
MAGTVTVALKHPHGLILRLFEMVDRDEPVMGGGSKTVKQAVQRIDTDPVRLYGYAAPMTPDGDTVLVAGGYALTPNVSADFWDAWLEQNRDLDLVKRNLIYAASRQGDAGAFAKEHKSQQSGLEPLDVEGGKDPRVNRRVRKMTMKDEAA